MFLYLQKDDEKDIQQSSLQLEDANNKKARIHSIGYTLISAFNKIWHYLVWHTLN